MQDKKSGRTGSGRMTVEKKMALAQYIRQENQDNRMKIRQRERILYGDGNILPLWEKGKYGQGMPEEQREQAGVGGQPYQSPQDLPTSTFRYRMILAILLFVGFLICDTNGSKLGKYSMNDIHEMIVADTFHLNESGEGAGGDGLAWLLDFGK